MNSYIQQSIARQQQEQIARAVRRQVVRPERPEPARPPRRRRVPWLPSGFRTSPA
jgi:hypothetical protein